MIADRIVLQHLRRVALSVQHAHRLAEDGRSALE